MSNMAYRWRGGASLSSGGAPPAPAVRSAPVDQGREEMRVEARRVEALALGQHGDRIVAVQALLMAGDDAKVADPLVALQPLGKEARGILHEDRIGGVELCESLLVLALDHDLR